VTARLRLTLSYAGFLMLAGALLLAVVWVFLLRGTPASLPRPSDFLRVFELRNFGPAVFVPAAIWALAFLLVFGLAGGWVLAGRMLAPLTLITDATRLVAGGSLTHRIRLSGRADEFRELADAVDAMLARIEAHVGEQQRFAANASHELRTPLAVTQSLLDVARLERTHDDALVDRLYVVNARAIRLTEALLVLSRAGQRAFAREPVDLSLLAEEAVETLLQLAEQYGVALECDGDVALVHGSPALLQQVATNLVHNAIVHNLPTGGCVWITVDGARLTVENTGEPLTPELVATLTEPFRRGTDRRGDGVGLGLAIVAAIVRAHDGTLTLTSRPTGGLHVAVELPSSWERTPL
jgi:two-component system, OmpR family, sensor histidine kinase VanS